jgi:hypothetical protein
MFLLQGRAMLRVKHFTLVNAYLWSFPNMPVLSAIRIKKSGMAPNTVPAIYSSLSAEFAFFEMCCYTQKYKTAPTI